MVFRKTAFLLVLSLAVCSTKQQSPTPATVQTAPPEVAKPEVRNTSPILVKFSEEGGPHAYVCLLRPEAFPELPEKFCSWLTRNGYLIPQYPNYGETNNVRSGQFIQPGQRAWAVLALRGINLDLIVFDSVAGTEPAVVMTKPLNTDQSEGNMRDSLLYVDLLDDMSMENAYFFYGETNMPPPFVTAENGDTVFLDGILLNWQDKRFSYYEDKRTWYYCSQGKWCSITDDSLRMSTIPIDTALIAPRGIPTLPVPVADWLEQGGYKIPVSFYEEDSIPDNVVQADFDGIGEPDIALLAVRDTTQFLLMFPEGRADTVLEVLKHLFVPGADAQKRKAFIWITIAAADKKYILEHYEYYGGNEPPKQIDHLGINYIFIEKASTVYYLENGQWLEFSGAD
ncbi:hypothetical protein LLH00_00260 [bacterium]|nr:hypothetical protein [bacterium]